MTNRTPIAANIVGAMPWTTKGRDRMTSTATATVTAMTDRDADAVLAIYQAGIDEGNATFETTAPSWDTFDRDHLKEHRFVAVDDVGTVLGWVACVPVSDRCVYAGVVEHSVYVEPAARGPGSGRGATA